VKTHSEEESFEWNLMPELMVLFQCRNFLNLKNVRKPLARSHTLLYMREEIRV
jgi:hypothetical protein